MMASQQDDIKRLIELLFSNNEWDAIAAAKKLGQLRAKDAVQALEQRLQATDGELVEVNQQARLAWDKGDHRGAITITEHLVGDIETLRLEIVRALGLIGDP